ncbi:MAG: rRNA maturation RNase YbeY, partial [Acidobacteriota bacterium]
DGRGRPVLDGGLARWLTGVAPARVRGDVAVALVTDPHIRRLNKTYRAKDLATDVLSFPAFETRPPAPGPRIPDPGSRAAVPALGDIVIATGVARRQAREAGHSFQTELRVLALHGLLHLLGYDHEDRADGGRMARTEARLRRKGGLASGLIARAGRAAESLRQARAHSTPARDRTPTRSIGSSGGRRRA